MRHLNKKQAVPAEDARPFPYRQLGILAICRLCEPVAFMSIFPYVYQMVRSFQVTQHENQVAIYAGLITSSFTFAEFLSAPLWGRLSDRIGRKPVILIGLAGTGVSMVMFGLATSLYGALLARVLGGLLNGNLGVLQSVLAEITSGTNNRARAYCVMPFVWSLGSIIGSAIGGALAEPASMFPKVFPPGSFFYRFPYLLSNLICAMFVVLGVAVGIFFLEETHEERKHSRYSLFDLRKWAQIEYYKRTSAPREKVHSTEETQRLLFEDFSDDPKPRNSDDTLSDCSTVSEQSSDALIRSDMLASPQCDAEPGSSCKTWTLQIILNILAYGVLAFHTIALEQLLPILMVEQRPTNRVSLPFLFSGGLNYSTQRIGSILALQGLLLMVVQVFAFPPLSKKIGSLRLFQATAATYPVLYFGIPYLTLVSENLRVVLIPLVLLLKVSGQAFSYPSLQMLLNDMAPKRTRGSLNGTGAAAASLGRTFGPTISGLIHAHGLKFGVSGLAWWTISLVAFLGSLESLFMRPTTLQQDVTTIDEEAVLAGPPGELASPDHGPRR